MFVVGAEEVSGSELLVFQNFLVVCTPIYHASNGALIFADRYITFKHVS
jgi:hypothetical protein